MRDDRVGEPTCETGPAWNRRMKAVVPRLVFRTKMKSHANAPGWWPQSRSLYPTELRAGISICQNILYTMEWVPTRTAEIVDVTHLAWIGVMWVCSARPHNPSPPFDCVTSIWIKSPGGMKSSSWRQYANKLPYLTVRGFSFVYLIGKQGSGDRDIGGSGCKQLLDAPQQMHRRSYAAWNSWSPFSLHVVYGSSGRKWYGFLR